MLGRCCIAVVIFAQIVGSPRPDGDPIDSAMVLVLDPSSGRTFGSGFVVERRNRVYVVTCRHVIEEADSPNLRAIPKPKKTKALSESDVLKLGKAIYHPDDAPGGTYDVAALQIVDTSLERLHGHGIVPVRLPRLAANEIKEGLALKVAGYPIEYAERELSLRSSEPLAPLRLCGTVRTVPLGTLTQNGFGAPLRAAYFAQADRPLGKGASGGPVYLDGRGTNVRVVGVLLASAEMQQGQLVGFVFASSDRIIETLR